jgi:hypothetical protein
MSENSYIGKQIGNYHIIAELASGSFGRVVRGEHTLPGKIVIIISSV